MADLIDITQDFLAAILAKKIALARLTVRPSSTLRCKDHNELILTARRITFPSIGCGVNCQQHNEVKVRHFMCN